MQLLPILVSLVRMRGMSVFTTMRFYRLKTPIATCARSNSVAVGAVRY